MNRDRLMTLIAPIVLGLISFFVVVGPLPLNPLNVSWLNGWDPQQEYFGWAIYRNGPWQFPLGLNPNFGLEFGSSIVYSDSIPLLALAFKLINFALPASFQYFGIWNLICFVLQSVFAWKLTEIFIKDKWILVLSTCLFVFAPVFLWKIGSSNSLISQFLILAALYLIFQKKNSKNSYPWLLLLVIAEGIHFYIFSMIAALWFAALLQKIYIEKQVTYLQALYQFIITLLVIGLMGWQFGYFAVGAGSATTGNYGLGAMNVLAPINASGWSYFIPSIPITPFNYAQSNVILNSVEGMNFLGAGSILAAMIAGVGVIKHKIPAFSWFKNYPFLFLSLFGLSLLAISNKVGIGPMNFNFPLPEKIMVLASMFRASGRMFWPVYYVLVLGSLVIISRTFKKHVAIFIIGCCALMQIIDTSAQWLPERSALAQASNSPSRNQLKNAFWDEAGKKYLELVRAPARNNSYDWALFAQYAAIKKMATNSVFLARYDETKLVEFNRTLDEVIASGQYKPSSLYVVDDGEIIPVLLGLDQSKHLFARIDDYNILAPLWKECISCTPSDNFDEYVDFLGLLKAQRRFNFSDRPSDRLSLALLSKGWEKPEPWGVWSGNKKVRLTIPVPLQGKSVLNLELRALISKNLPFQEVKVFVDNEFFEKFTLSHGDGNKINLKLSEKLKQKKFIVLDLELPNAAKPIDLGITRDDERLLAIGLVSLGWD